MKPISPEALDIVMEYAPRFVEAVHRAARMPHKKTANRSLIATLSDYDDNPTLLYACLWYARTHGVIVTFR